MGETILKVPLSELDIVRVRCQKCSTIVEVPLGRIGLVLDGLKCKHCPSQVLPSPSDNPLHALAHAIHELKQINQLLTIEFVVKPEA